MATIQHNAILDNDRHEAKGASTAAIGTALFSNGNGTTSFRLITYGDLSTKPTSSGYKPDLSCQSVSASQTPVSSNTTLQIEFGPTSSTSNTAMSSAGALTFTKAGDYLVRYGLAFKGSASGSIIFFRIKVNGNPLEPTHRMQLQANEITEYTETFSYSATAGDVVTFEIVSDSTGGGIGGLAQATPSASGWAILPTAELSVYKFFGIN